MNIDRTPPFWLRHPMVQSTLGSRGSKATLSRKREDYIFHAYCPQEDRQVKLLGHFDLQPEQAHEHCRKLAVLLHGWEGSAESAYILRMGAELMHKGWDILRLNLRDHGPTHHLNPGLFNGSLIHEVYDAIRYGAEFWKERVRSEPEVIVAGFSMGGNFALRVAGSHSISKLKIPGLKHCYAISPAVDPEKTTALLDSHPVLSHYFLRKWFQSLKLKEKLFPELYRFGSLREARDVMTLTDRVARLHSHYSDASHYFQSYTIRKSHAEQIQVPVTILTSADDPIISPEELEDWNSIPNINLIVTRFGGHNGFFLNGLQRPAYLDLIQH